MRDRGRIGRNQGWEGNGMAIMGTTERRKEGRRDGRKGGKIPWAAFCLIMIAALLSALLAGACWMCLITVWIPVDIAGIVFFLFIATNSPSTIWVFLGSPALVVHESLVFQLRRVEKSEIGWGLQVCEAIVTTRFLPPGDPSQHCNCILIIHSRSE
jgi:hypothetical protein